MTSASPGEPARRLRDDDLHGDVGAGRTHGVDQPRPGLPRRGRPVRRARGGRPGDPRRPQPVRAAAGRARARRRDRRAPARPLRARARGDPGHVRRHRGDHRRAARAVRARATRCSRSTRSTTPTAPGAALAGARLVGVPLTPPEWRFDAESSPPPSTPRTRVLLLNSPHNPTGRVLDRAELEQIAAACVEHDLIAISDEVYEHLVFEGEHVPLATLPGMAERTLTVSSIGKTFSVTGWKTGWACGPAELVAATRGAKQFMTFAGGTPFQHAAAHRAGRRRGARRAPRRRAEGQARPHLRGPRARGRDVLRPAGHLLRQRRRAPARLRRRRRVLPRAPRARRRRRDPHFRVLRAIPNASGRSCASRSASARRSSTRPRRGWDGCDPAEGAHPQGHGRDGGARPPHLRERDRVPGDDLADPARAARPRDAWARSTWRRSGPTTSARSSGPRCRRRSTRSATTSCAARWARSSCGGSRPAWWSRSGRCQARRGRSWACCRRSTTTARTARSGAAT